MRTIFTLLAGAALLFCSCSSSHKVQNSDDPGYSSSSSRASSRGGQSDYYNTAPSDQYVRMKTTDQARWSTFDDYNDYDNFYAPAPYASAGYGVGYSPFGYGYGMYGYPSWSIGMGFWDPYFGWNSYFLWNTCYNPYFYNPYYGGSIVVVKYPNGSVGGGGVAGAPSPHFYNRMSAFNASTYHSTGFVNANHNNRFYRPSGTPFSSSSPSNSGTGRRINNNNNSFFSRGNPNSNMNNSPRPPASGGSFGGSSFGGGGSQQPARTFTPSGGGGGGMRGGFRH